MKLTEQSTVAEHLKALVEKVTLTEKLYYRVTANSPLTQDDWDSILKEIGWEYFVAPHSIHLWQGHYTATKNIPQWQFTKELFSSKHDAASAAGCAAIRIHLKGKP